MDGLRYKRGGDSIFAVPSFPPQGAFVKLYRWSCYCASLSSVSVNSTTAGEEGESRRKERKRRRDNDFHLVRYAAAATKVHNSPNDTNEISFKLISWCSTFCIKTILCFESQKIVEFHTFEREGFFSFSLPSRVRYCPPPLVSHELSLTAGVRCKRVFGWKGGETPSFPVKTLFSRMANSFPTLEKKENCEKKFVFLYYNVHFDAFTTRTCRFSPIQTESPPDHFPRHNPTHTPARPFCAL